MSVWGGGGAARTAHVTNTNNVDKHHHQQRSAANNIIDNSNRDNSRMAPMATETTAEWPPWQQSHSHVPSYICIHAL